MSKRGVDLSHNKRFGGRQPGARYLGSLCFVFFIGCFFFDILVVTSWSQGGCILFKIQLEEGVKNETVEDEGRALSLRGLFPWQWQPAAFISLTTRMAHVH